MSLQANYDDVLGQLEGYGLLLDGFMDVGTPRPVRCKVENGDREKRGWYWLNEVQIDGAAYIVGAYGIYHGNDSGKQTVKLNRDGKQLVVDAALREAMKARQAENLKRMKAMRAAEAERAAREAARVWNAYLPNGACDYLERKGVGSHGVRFDPNGHGTMLVPMCDASGKIHGLQIIRGRNRGKKLEKQYFPAGLAKQGHYHLIGGVPSWICLVAEGYATAATLHEATGLPVAVAFDAGNLMHVATALHKHYKRARLLICADDDYLTEGNPGITAASNAALAVDGAWVKPEFAADRDGKKVTDFNDLHALEGLHAVRGQIEGRLLDLKWEAPAARAGALIAKGGGENGAMPSLFTVDEAVLRFWGTYGMGGKVLFDEVERRLVHKDDVMNLLPDRAWGEIKRHPGWRVARDREIGFDPTERDPEIRCNLFGGWPTVPVRGKCDLLLELLLYLCNGERAVYEWVLRWLAYPLQHRGAKMHSAIVVHGPQGTGKSRFFEAIVDIYGTYGRVLGQEALEDKFNADWAEKKLFILADEVLARQDMFHLKNRLKGFITGGTIRVNPKNVAAHNERNHMNIVFLSNEKQPLVIENDDRRHMVIYTPPKPDEAFFTELNEEVDAGGVAALHDHLLTLDLGDFKPWTKPPMTAAKEDLIELGRSSEERFFREWQRLEIEGKNGDPLPLCPCLGSALYRVYEEWCKRQGEFRPRPNNHFINFIAKQPGWQAGKPVHTWVDSYKTDTRRRRMVIPSLAAMEDAKKADSPGGDQKNLVRECFASTTDWLTAGHEAFSRATEAQT